MKEILELANKDLKDKTVIMRVDYNVPIQDGKVIDDLRIRASFKTVGFLTGLGAKVLLISHIEGKGGSSLFPVSEHIHKKFMENLYPFDVNFIGAMNDAGEESFKFVEIKERIQSLPESSVILLENLRFDPREKKNDAHFATSLATLGDIYVGDAFSVSHRAHASVVALPQLFPHDHYAGFQIIEEVSHLEEGIHPPRPFIFILGGAKFDTKIPLIEKFINKADNVVIGGALLNDIMKAKGWSVGKSLISDKDVDLSAIVDDPRLIFPSDLVVENCTTKSKSTKKISEIGEDDAIMDVGESLTHKLKEIFNTLKEKGQSPFILWNGPMGNYESGYKEGTISLVQLLIDSKVKALLGGGDTSAAISEGGLTSKIEGDPEIKDLIYISTGGGAMIDYLIDETLPGIEALK